MKVNILLLLLIAFFCAVFAASPADVLADAVAEAIVTLVDGEEALSDGAPTIRVTVDGKYANENWIQLKVSPPKTVSYVKVISKGRSFHAPNPSWDHNQGANFVGKAKKISYGSHVTVRAFLRSGGSVDVPLTWRKGASGSSKDKPKPKPSKPKKGGNKKPPKSSSGQGASKNPSIRKVVSMVNKFKRSSGYPQAHITGEDSLRKRNKLKLNNALNELHITDLKTRAFLFTVFTIETEQMYYQNGEAQRDTSKDHDKLSKNVSPVNMNIDMLKRIGFKGNPTSLNRLSNIKTTVKTVLLALNKLGLEGFLNFHRGGATGYAKPSTPKFKIPVFKDGVYNVMKEYMRDQSLFTDGRKVWADIPHV